MPFRVPLGDDAYESALSTVEARNANVRDWKEWTTGTNYD